MQNVIKCVCIFTGKTVDTTQKQSTLCYDNYSEDQTKQYAMKENKVPVIPDCYNMFSALLRQRTRNKRILMFLIHLAVLGLVALAYAIALQNVRKSIIK